MRGRRLRLEPSVVMLSKTSGCSMETSTDFLRKEVIQPQVPLRLPCYDFTPVSDPAVVGCPHLSRKRGGWRTGLRPNQIPWCDGRCVQGPGTYSPRRADPRLLAIPPSCTRVAECNLN